MLDILRSAWSAFASIPNLGLYLVLGWLTYVVWLGLWIVLQKREPVATLSWLISLAALPYIGFLIYFFFGPQRIRRQRLRRVRARATLPPPPEGLVPTPDAIELARLAQSTTGLPPITATRVDLLIDGSAKYVALLEAIANARDHIHLEYYIYLPDRTGTALRDALVERARAGVQVRLLLDAVGSGRTKRKFLQPLVEAGAEVAWFHPMKLQWFWKRPWLNLRTHRKIVVIDGEIGFTGGINITDEEDDRLREDAYRDLHLRLEGDIVRELQLVFIEDWAYATGEPPLRVHHPAPRRGTISAQVLVSGPDSSWEAIHRVHVAAIHSRAASRVAGDAVFRAGRGGAHGADLGGAGRARRATAGAEGLRQPTGDARRAVVLRRAARSRRQGARVRPAHAAQQGAALRRRPGDRRQCEFRPPQLPAQLRGLGVVPRQGAGCRAGVAHPGRVQSRATCPGGSSAAAVEHTPAGRARAAGLAVAVTAAALR
ncbi:phosphatidylserine/phosphatidylglycerophosphate/cardiolipin synthase-like enzyme [Lysobacter sp. OAE881]